MPHTSSELPAAGDLPDQTIGAMDHDRPWTTPMAELVDLLRLDELGSDAFGARHSEASRNTGHVFGGLVAAQALVAAARTVDIGRAPHSLHAYFLRPGDPAAPLRIEVARNRDGRSFSHRTVTVLQHGRTIMEMACSFAAPRDGLQHQLAAPAAPAPETARPDHEWLGEAGEEMSPYGTTLDAFELRTVGLGRDWFTERVAPGTATQVWMRAGAEVPDDPILHAAALTFASDMRILHPAVRPHGLGLYGEVGAATIDHALWFHGPFDAEAWSLWQMTSPWADHGRTLCRAEVYSLDGRLLASVAQEGLVRA
ncbi:acyl-CoA thioesterase [Nocardioides sambongensis]|uniref:acyl-CoA thioesterase n=1 Tax=Nocardioides sambongensis TaxID=2589074 RepID=UPI00112D6BC6|nr:acyl-CoA thioesterase domain-containing protein [Nocardioides sambongensis]